MCNPAIAIAGAQAALEIGGQVVGYMGERQAYKANETAANLTFANQSNIINQRATQLGQEESESAFDTAIASQVAQGRISASASDQGLGNASFISEINSQMFGIGRQSSIDDANFANTRLQLANEKIGADLSRVSQINSRTKPSALGLALGIGSSLTKAASSSIGATSGARK